MKNVERLIIIIYSPNYKKCTLANAGPQDRKVITIILCLLSLFL